MRVLAIMRFAAAVLLFTLLPVYAETFAQTPVPAPDVAQGPVPPAATVPTEPVAPVATAVPDWAIIPPDAIGSGILDGVKGWEWNHDPYTTGGAQPTSNHPIYPDGRQGYAGRQFVTYYSGGPYAGALWHLSFGRDSRSHHFAYTAKVYLVDPTHVSNVEMDVNQVMNDGRTVILGLQCAGTSKTWEYTTVSGNATHWHPSNIACNPATWGAKKWHDIELFSERDDNGNVTYNGVCFDGNCQAFKGASGPSALALNWTPHDLVLNYQTDSAKTSGFMDTYLRDLQIYRW
jgi:hypothetical protein